MTDKTSTEITNNSSFIVYRSELQERWDPVMVIYNRKVQKFLFATVPLKDLLLCDPQYGANEKGLPRSSKEQIRYIRITDIDDSGLLREELGATVANAEEQYSIQPKDILIARSGATVGKTYIHKAMPYPCIFAGYMIRFIIDNKKVLPEYVFAYTQLKPYKGWVKAIQRAAAQPNINAEEYKSLRIPLPSFEIQNRIVSIMQEAYDGKKEKESDALRLIGLVDTLMTKELGISSEDNSALDYRRFGFFVQYRDITESRLDPIYYNADIKKFTNCTYSERLSSLAYSFTSGFAVGRQDQVKEENGILQIRPTNIDNNGCLKYDKNVYVAEMKDAPFVESGVVLFNNTNSQEWVGKTAYFANEEKRKVYISNHITAIEVDRSKILPEYLCAILNMYQRHKVFYSICTNWNNQSGIGLDLLKSLHIPLFTDDRKESLHRQQQIVDRINTIYQEADECILSANQIINEAKAKVESMIIGE